MLNFDSLLIEPYLAQLAKNRGGGGKIKIFQEFKSSGQLKGLEE